MNDLLANRLKVLAQIQMAAVAAGRDAETVRLIAVGKTFPATDIATLYQAGQRDFGENYIQEWQQKVQDLRDSCPDLVWHIIGHIQSNKSRVVAEQATWVHTLDSVKLARRLSHQRPSHLPPLQLCIEVNTSASVAKHGVAPNEVMALAEEVAALPNVCLRGLMCVPTADNREQTVAEFALMRDLLADLQQKYHQVDTLSMGMSGDLADAVAHGATMVRIGRAIFGSRS